MARLLAMVIPANTMAQSATIALDRAANGLRFMFGSPSSLRESKVYLF